MQQSKKLELRDSFRVIDEEGKAHTIEEWVEVRLIKFGDATPPTWTDDLKSYNLEGSTTKLNKIEEGAFQVPGGGKIFRRVP